MRLFIAALPEEPVRRALVAAQERLRRSGAQGRFVPEENLHMTMAFLGEVSDCEVVLEAMDAMRFEPFPLRLEGELGLSGDALWAGVSPNGTMSACASRLRRSLSEAGLPFDRRRFMPHITLLRGAKGIERGLPEDVVRQAAMTAERLFLMRSDRGKNGMIYTRID